MAQGVQIAVVTDELSDDLETALELASEMEIRHVELRGVGGRRVPRVGPFWMERIPKFLDRYHMQVVAISPGLFKVPWPRSVPDEFQVLRWQDMEEHAQTRLQIAAINDHRSALLLESIEFARLVNCSTIVVFSFIKSVDGPIPPAAYATLAQAAREAQEEGVRLVVENEHICWADTGVRTAELVGSIALPSLAINWDPGNAYAAGEVPFPEGYRAVREWMKHIHVKDARRTKTGVEWALRGEIDWEGQLKALLRDGYTGPVVIETHVRPKVAGVREMLGRVRAALT